MTVRTSAMLILAVVSAGGLVNAQEWKYGGGVPEEDFALKTVGRRYTPVPLLNYDSDDGVGYGVRLNVYDYDGKTVPYRRGYKAQFFMTTEGNWYHQLSADIPQLLPGQRFDLQLSIDRLPYANYYGELSDAEVDSMDLSKAQRTFKATSPKLNIQWIRDIRLPWRHKVGLAVNHTSISANSDSGNILGELRPIGFKGGWLLKLNTSVRYDTRDNYVDTHSGFLEELLLEYKWGPSDFAGWLISYEHRHFVPFGGAWVLAYRVEVDRVFGEIPFYEELKLGGDGSIRGLPSARVRGQGRFLTNTEVRWRGLRLSEKKNIVLGAIGFVDIGHIYNREHGPSFDPGEWRSSYGYGLRFHWYSTIIRMDYGRSKDRTGLYIEFNHIF